MPNTNSAMTDAISCRDNNDLSTFFATFPTQLHCTKMENSPHIRVFWSQTHSNSSSDDVSDPLVIHEKIKSAFCKVDLSELNGLIQFWAPVNTTRGRRILSTSDQPFVLEHLDSLSHKYRLACISYQYNLDDNNNKNKLQVGEKEEPMIISGAPATAFLNHLPVVVNLRVNQGSPLVASALKYQLTTSLLLPVVYPGSQSSNCVGVVECSMPRSILVGIFNKLKSALESVGLSTFDAQERLPYKSICGLKHARDEVQEALEIVCESHDLALAQVWIAWGNHVPFSRSSEESQTKQKFGVKLIGYCVDSDDRLSYIITNFYDTCDKLPLRVGEGVSGKTLQTYEPHFCRNINELRDNGVMALLPGNTEYSCLVMCLRCNHTGKDVDYAFEFLWPKSRNYLILLESLLLTLKSCLPSFKFASGAQLGDELCIIDAENSTGSGIGFFKILEGNRISLIPKALEKRRRLIVEDCMSFSKVKLNQVTEFVKESACTLNPESNVLGNSEWKEPEFVKTKTSDSCESKSESSEEDSEDHIPSSKSIERRLAELRNDDAYWFDEDSSEEDSTENQKHSASSNSVRCPGNDGLVIKVEYGDRRMLSYLPISSKLVDIKKNIDDKYNLGDGGYKLQFLDCVNEWLRLVDEEDWENCIIHGRINKTQSIHLRVLPFTDLMVP